MTHYFNPAFVLFLFFLKNLILDIYDFYENLKLKIENLKIISNVCQIKNSQSLQLAKLRKAYI